MTVSAANWSKDCDLCSMTTIWFEPVEQLGFWKPHKCSFHQNRPGLTRVDTIKLGQENHFWHVNNRYHMKRRAAKKPCLLTFSPRHMTLGLFFCFLLIYIRFSNQLSIYTCCHSCGEVFTKGFFLCRGLRCWPWFKSFPTYRTGSVLKHSAV